MGCFLLTSIFVLFVGSQGFKIQPRILNGIKSNPQDFPFFVYLDMETGECSGSLISDRWIVTAAHCIDRREKTKAHFGIDANGEFSEIVEVKRKNQFAHPGYDDDKFINDIALLKLSHRVKFRGNIQAAKLPTDCRSMQNGNESVIAAGVGYYTIENSEFNDEVILRQANFTTVSTKNCKKIIDEVNFPSMICVKVENNQSAYNGDSGGPLVQANDGTLIGVMNFVDEDHGFDLPQLRCQVQAFANIRYHFKWISQVTGLQLPKCFRTIRDEFIFNFPKMAKRLRMRLDD